MEEENLNIKKNVVLAPYTTFGIGGPADYFLEVKNQKDIIGAITWAKRKKIPYFILGGGSNILISDKGVKGLVIKLTNSQVKVKNSLVYAEAGIPTNELVQKTIEKGLGGLEYFIGLPGTIGGAIYKNSHWCGHYISDNLLKVEVLDKDLKKEILPRSRLDFSYDWSGFQKKEGIILRTFFALKKTDKSLLKDTIRCVLKRRRNNHPKGLSAGCIFKNPNHQSAGKLIGKVGLKGKRLGGIVISKKHANFFINTGKGKAKEVMSLIKLAQGRIKNKFNINLVPEIFFWGKFD